MRISIFWCSILLIASSIGCQSSDQNAIALRSSSPQKNPALAFTTFSSASTDATQTQLLLYPDSTFQLLLPSSSGSAVRDIQGELTIAEDHYQLFFPDTISQLNELVTPVHPDASVVVYPDGSVALDKALRQFYVRGKLVTNDTLAEKPSDTP